eukprot:1157013-Pelagomonas_calceolata.AAC.17
MLNSFARWGTWLLVGAGIGEPGQQLVMLVLSFSIEHSLGRHANTSRVRAKYSPWACMQTQAGQGQCLHSLSMRA